MPSRPRVLSASLLALTLACTPKDKTPDPKEPTRPVPSSQASAPPPAPGPRPEPAVKATLLTQETSMTLPAGATYLAPKEWSFYPLGETQVLVAPEGDLHLVVSVEAGSDFATIAASVWKRFDPAFAYAVGNKVSPPASDGWDEIVQLEYDIPVKEGRAAIAVGRRKGSRWYVHLFDGTAASLDRRGAQAMAAFGSLKAGGVEDESYAKKTPRPFDAERLALLERDLIEAMESLKLPGASVAIVQDGKIIYEKGFGVRELGKKEKVTPKTAFMIGSATKPLTSLLMAALIDEGKFSWDTPVTALYPSFALADAEISKQLTMRHTVCACTGLPRQDFEFIFEYAGNDAETRVASMKGMKPTTKLGETFQYSNMMVAAGGYIAARAAEPKKSLEAAYEGLMKAKVFGPLKMNASASTLAGAKKLERASPHGLTIENQYQPIGLSYEAAVEAVSPAGAAWSTAGDMARYVLFELNRGKGPDGKQIISEENVLKRRQPQVAIDDKDAYGLGLFLEEVKGVPLIGHNGNTLGFSSLMMFLPEQGVGLVILSNGQASNPFLGTVRRRFLELLFDGKEEAKERFAFSRKSATEEIAKELAKLSPSIDAGWIKPYLGTYRTEGLGQLVLREEKGAYVIDVGEWKSEVRLREEKDGSKMLVLMNPPVAGLPFLVEQKEGRPQMVLNAGQKVYTFQPVP